MAAAVPPPPLSALPGGFLKQLVRDSEKETKQKEPEVKEEKPVSGSSSSQLSSGRTWALTFWKIAYLISCWELDEEIDTAEDWRQLV